MRLQLSFKNLAQNLHDAVAHVRVNDASEFDAPAVLITSADSEKFDVLQPNTVAKIDVVLSFHGYQAELSLSVKVEGVGEDNELMRFISTSLITVEQPGNKRIAVLLERI